jgi:hypothetical protein
MSKNSKTATATNKATAPAATVPALPPIAPAAAAMRYSLAQQAQFAALLGTGASLAAIKRAHGISRHTLRAIAAKAAAGAYAGITVAPAPVAPATV